MCLYSIIVWICVQMCVHSFCTNISFFFKPVTLYSHPVTWVPRCCGSSDRRVACRKKNILCVWNLHGRKELLKIHWIFISVSINYGDDTRPDDDSAKCSWRMTCKSRDIWDADRLPRSSKQDELRSDHQARGKPKCYVSKPQRTPW